MERIISFPNFFSGTLISSAACGITSNQKKKKGVITATLAILPTKELDSELNS